VLVSVHLCWELSSQSISEQRQEFLRFDSDMYRTKEHRASRRANISKRISSAPIGAMHDMNSYASKSQSSNILTNSISNGINSRKAHEAGMFMGKSRKSNNFHDTVYLGPQR
jgi:hypothetical protein